VGSLIALAATAKTDVQSAVDGGGVENRGGADACALRKILGKLTVPRPRGFGHRSLGRHPFFDRTPTVITLVRLHLPLHSVLPTITRGWLSNG